MGAKGDIARLASLASWGYRNRDFDNQYSRDAEFFLLTSGRRVQPTDLRRPEIAARDLLAECLILVYPPIAHPDSTTRDQPDSSYHSRSARKDTFVPGGHLRSVRSASRSTMAQNDVTPAIELTMLMQTDQIDRSRSC
jgi:hypothetical protein